MNVIKRILAVMLVAVMALSLVGCGDTGWICRVDNVDIASGIYIFYQTQGYGEAVTQLAQQDSQTYLYPYIYYLNYGTVVPEVLDASMSDGTTVKDYINKYAMDMCKQVLVIERLYNDLGLEADGDLELYENKIRTNWVNSKSNWEDIGVSESSYKTAMLSSYKESKLFEAYYEVGGINGTTEEEVKTYFADKYARIKSMTFRFADNTDDAIDAARKDEQLKLANDYLALAQSGSDFDELIEQYNEYLETVEKLENDDENAENDENTDVVDNADADDGHDHEGESADTAEDEYKNESVISKDSTYPTEKFVNYVFTTVKVGEFSVIQDDTCFYLVQRLDVNERTDLYDTYRSSLISDLFDKDFTKLINDKLSGYNVEVNDASVKRYTVDKAFPDAQE